ncbi:MAG: alpha/beta hydrolase [Deltaproteobacteria bacterium HGW-Deltaproteobacteria-19]|jgi:pimeloyl-ACP methyl ester carboxylesterase|nr:MAG: alpha/beta hydrolase [Deltaproteobacteria bacterium HGW-Deltaproteobacteria-19]
MQSRHFEISVRGRLLAVQAVGTGGASRERSAPAILFLHEGLGSIGQWRDFPEALCARTGTAGFVYDRLGYGRSDTLPAPRTVRYLHDEALKALPAVLDALGLERPFLVGHSDGGTIALLFAAEYPDRVRGVITEAAHVFVEEETLRGIREAVDLYRTTDLRERMARYHGDKVDAVFSGWADTWLSAEFRDWNVESFLPRVSCPLLVIQGVDDRYGTPAQVEAIVCGAAGPAEALLLPDCGHIPHQQARDRVLDAMTRFIRSLPGTA